MSNWYLQNGKESDIVLSSRVRLARNLKQFNFPGNLAEDESLKVLNKIEELAPCLGYGLKFLKLENIDDITEAIVQAIDKLLESIKRIDWTQIAINELKNTKAELKKSLEMAMESQFNLDEAKEIIETYKKALELACEELHIHSIDPCCDLANPSLHNSEEIKEYFLQKAREENESN